MRGSLLMAVAMAGFSVTDVISKFLTAEMNFGQVMLLRGLFAAVLVCALAVHQRVLRPLRVLLVTPVLLRMIGEVGGTMLFLAAITHLPLGNVSAIIQSQPLVITLGAVLILGEQVGWRRWLAMIAGFAGVLIVVRPGVAGFNQFTLLALGAVAFYALRDIATKQIPAEIPALFVTLLTTVVVMAAGGLAMIPLGGFAAPSGHGLALLALAALLMLIGYQCIILALRAGDLSAVAPFRYTQLLWAMLFGYLVFGDAPDAAMVAGATVIVLSGIYTFHRESVRNRPLASNTPAVPPDGL
jgi:drug/metabolite transporter (DMT)-like permease